MTHLFMRFCSAPRLTFDVFIIAFGIGIATYFSLAFEPRLIFLFMGILGGGFCLWWTRKSGRDIWVWAFLAWTVLVGCGFTSWHSHMKSPGTLPVYERAYDVTGWVESISASGKGVRWHIVVERFEDFPRSESPKKLRVRLGQKHKEAARAGDRVSLRAILSAPPGPAVPHGYNPAQRAFFEEFGGFGFAISVPEVQAMEGPVSFKRRLAHFRYNLAERIMSVAPEQTAGLQAALLTGVRRYIPQEQTDALRAAGLAHILAISGLHMGLLAGSAFYIFTLILAAVRPLSRRYDVRKIAAGLGIIAATAYLLLSGASVATQRAYIMAVIIFLAVMLDRRALSVRSVSVAAFLTLLFHPEALISVGFQMSFAAVLALVVVYRYWQDYRPAHKGFGFFKKVRNNIVSLSVTSFVAGLATAGFALFHFGRIARYGLAGNLLAMPLFTFAIMPLGIVALVLMPLGLEEAPLWLMGQGVAQLVNVSTWISGWDGALFRSRAAPSWVIGVYGLAFVLGLIGRWRAKIFAGGLVLACIIAWWGQAVPDIRISEEGRVAFWETAELQRLIVTSKRADSYGREQFSEKAGRADVEAIPLLKTDAPCDELACRFGIKNYRVSFLNHPSEVRTECETSDLVILSVRDAGPEVRRNCKAVLIDGRVLREKGAIEVYLLDDETIDIVGAKPKLIQRRLWHNY